MPKARTIKRSKRKRVKGLRSTGRAVSAIRRTLRYYKPRRVVRRRARLPKTTRTDFVTLSVPFAISPHKFTGGLLDISGYVTSLNGLSKMLHQLPVFKQYSDLYSKYRINGCTFKWIPYTGSAQSARFAYSVCQYDNAMHVDYAAGENWTASAVAWRPKAKVMPIHKPFVYRISFAPEFKRRKMESFLPAVFTNESIYKTDLDEGRGGVSLNFVEARMHTATSLLEPRRDDAAEFPIPGLLRFSVSLTFKEKRIQHSRDLLSIPPQILPMPGVPLPLFPPANPSAVSLTAAMELETPPPGTVPQTPAMTPRQNNRAQREAAGEALLREQLPPLARI